MARTTAKVEIVDADDNVLLCAVALLVAPGRLVDLGGHELDRVNGPGPGCAHRRNLVVESVSATGGQHDRRPRGESGGELMPRLNSLMPCPRLRMAVGKRLPNSTKAMTATTNSSVCPIPNI